jgi:hypothetical protein
VAQESGGVMTMGSGYGYEDHGSMSGLIFALMIILLFIYLAKPHTPEPVRTLQPSCLNLSHR